MYFVKFFAVYCCVVVCLIGGAWGGPQAPQSSTDPAGADSIRFNRDIRPILSENCYRCHGPEPAQRQADLRLDLRDEVIAAGVIQPGDAEASALIERIFEADPDMRMPPPESNKSLTPIQRELLRRWIAEGAEYEGHWAYEPPRVPESLMANQPVASAIDVLIDRQLSKAGLVSAGPANNLTLLRRLYLDLVGLPPPAELARAIADKPKQAWYAATVDRLLESPHFGERMAIAWLDVVRYADTVGYHGDQNQNVFPYRDWVIDAINQNMPFDRFTEYQLAGDLIESPTAESLTASCFNRLNMMTREGGAQPTEYLTKYAADRVRTVSAAWLGTTLGCAECHDHKFDPFTSRDFYSMAAFFADLQQWGVYQDYDYTPNPDLRGWSNDHPFPPEIMVDVPYLHRRIARLRSEVEQVCADAWMAAEKNQASAQRREQWYAATRCQIPLLAQGWRTVSPLSARNAKDEPVSLATDGSGRASFERTNGEPLVVQVKTDIPIHSVRLMLLGGADDDEHAWPQPATDQRIQLSLARVDPGDTSTALKVAFADTKIYRPRYASTHEIPGIVDQWIVPGDIPAGSSGVWQLESPVHLASDETLEIRLSGVLSARVRILVSPFALHDLQQPEAWGVDFAALAQAEHAVLANSWLARQAALAGVLSDDVARRVRDLEAQIRMCRGGKSPVQISQPAIPIVTRILPRGNWQDESGEVVGPSVPVALPSSSLPADRTLTRLDLAKWLTAAENPLTARVQMNRLWRHFFGSGLSPVLDDFGMQGQYPSHPELLDWLAVEFHQSGWNLKHMVRQIVMSEAYQRSSIADSRAVELDPANLWLSHQNPRRLEAEVIRDTALQIAGLINLERGGPPAFPYQPPDYYAHLQFPDRRYAADRDDRQYRRGVYMHWQRTFLHPMLAAFDAPSREECTALRTQANTPLQALTLLNDPTFVEAAKHLALRALRESGKSDRERIEFLTWQTLSRPASDSEVDVLSSFAGAERARWQADPEKARELLNVGLQSLPAEMEPVEAATWTSVARALLNSHETITRY